MLLLSLLATLVTSLPLVSASVFLEEGADLLYSASVLQTAASLDHSAAAAALAWRFTLRMQVRTEEEDRLGGQDAGRNVQVDGDNIHMQISNLTMSEHVGSWDTR